MFKRRIEKKPITPAPAPEIRADEDQYTAVRSLIKALTAVKFSCDNKNLANPKLDLGELAELLKPDNNTLKILYDIENSKVNLGVANIQEEMEKIQKSLAASPEFGTNSIEYTGLNKAMQQASEAGLWSWAQEKSSLRLVQNGFGKA